MVKIRPFKGIRPKQALSEAVASPPYDVLSTKEVEEIVARQPQSFLRIIPLRDEQLNLSGALVQTMSILAALITVHLQHLSALQPLSGKKQTLP